MGLLLSAIRLLMMRGLSASFSWPPMVVVAPSVTTVLGARTAAEKGNEMTSFDLQPAAVSRF